MPRPIKIVHTNITLEFSDKTPILVEYFYSPGSPGKDPTRFSPGEPTIYPEVDIQKVFLDLPSGAIPKRINLSPFLTEDSLADLRATIEEKEEENA